LEIRSRDPATPT